MDPLDAITRTLAGSGIAARRPLHGGDLSEVTRLTLEDGRDIVAKTGPMVDREARMLGAIRAARAPAPAVIGVSDDVLLMEALDEAGPGDGSWAAVAKALATLHADTGEDYGWDEDYAFGRVEIVNAPRDDWPAFWGENRLRAHLPHLPGALSTRLEALIARLADILPERPRPALLHGDLWTGNLLFGPAPAVHFIDPACYYGDPEVDLAMLHLFGAPGPGFDAAYGPLDQGWEERRAVYTLWPALVHLRLFGAGYRGLVERLLDELGH
ncbi:phosphotransferase [Maritimibacter sp. DP07]|uniref:Phosphotransferase n=1 Tax=Maritimibacter harenae TaxID=2606218 RepID=A0A845M5F7_9RHOB|nr:fructosamine kinase family protein [Maritimibacter harenae]MZR12703.1 phosphotransferase [Maritimibacter harenae]